MPTTHHPLGIDIGGSGIKGAPVDLAKGRFAKDRLRFENPKRSTPDAVVDIVVQIAEHFADDTGDSPIGVTLPAVVTNGVVRTAANIDPAWIGTDARKLLSDRLGRPVTVVNDADAAGLGELEFGAARNAGGLVLVSTLGTGIGSALFYDGVLVPNLELGHMEIRGRDAERRSAAAARVRRGISWKAWAADLDEHLLAIEKLFSPRLFIIGGGVSKRSERFVPRLTVRAEVIPARLLNDAGIVGAAMAADERERAAH